jgi:hypothetical protein
MAENLMPLFLTRPLLRDRARCRQGLSCRTRRSVVFLCPFVAACHAAPMDKEDGQACDKRGTQEACAPHVTAAGTVRLLGHPEMKICPETNTFSSVMNRCSNTPCTAIGSNRNLLPFFSCQLPSTILALLCGGRGDIVAHREKVYRSLQVTVRIVQMRR